MSFIQVRHNIEVAHRLYLTEGKCEAIHGHSMWVELRLSGHVNSNGLLSGLEFGHVKKLFREYLDTNYDHRLLLNKADPFAQKLHTYSSGDSGVELPGLRPFEGDPTTENIAREIARWATKMFSTSAGVMVHETSVNGAYHTEEHRL